MEDRKYIPVTWGDVGRFFLFLAAAGLTVLNFFLMIQSWKTLGLGRLSDKQQYSFSQLAICWVLIGEYFLISVSVICLIALIKKGFKNLKPFKKKGLTALLIAGLIAGLIVGLITGLIAGLTALLIAGLIAGLTVWLIAGFIVGLIVGLIVEFDDP